MSEKIIDFGQNPYALVPVEEFRRVVGWKEAAYRSALRDGLKPTKLGNRAFIRVADWHAYIDSKSGGRS